MIILTCTIRSIKILNAIYTYKSDLYYYLFSLNCKYHVIGNDKYENIHSIYGHCIKPCKNMCLSQEYCAEKVFVHGVKL